MQTQNDKQNINKEAKQNKNQDKHKALNQLDDIHNYLIDKESIIPYGANSLFVWAFISAILFLGFESISQISLFYAMFGILAITFFGLGVGIYYNKKENSKYELLKFTKSQKFILINQLMLIGIGIMFSYVFVANDIGYYCYPTWIFLIGFLNLNIGLILNSSMFKIISIINIAVSLLMFIILIGEFAENMVYYFSFISTFICSGSLLYLGIMAKNNKRT